MDDDSQYRVLELQTMMPLPEEEGGCAIAYAAARVLMEGLRGREVPEATSAERNSR
jgi:hypothetical protein